MKMLKTSKSYVNIILKTKNAGFFLLKDAGIFYKNNTMKQFIFYSLLIVLVISGCDTSPKSDKGDATQIQNAKLPVVQAVELAAAMETDDELELQLTGTIVEVCHGSGCWLEMDMGNGQRVLVTFPKDVYVVDTTAIGKPAIIDGLVTKEIISVKRLQLQAADEGASDEEINAITQPVAEFSLEAKHVGIR